MKHRFFVRPDQIGKMGVLFPEETARQIRQVLRLHPGETVTVLDGQGMEYSIQLETVSNEKVWGRLMGQNPSAGEPAVQVRLYLSLTQREKFEWALQKCTEVGVSCFVPVISSRTLARDKEQAMQKTDRWVRILKEAAEQSGRGLIPAILPPATLSDALAQAKETNLPSAFLWEGPTQTAYRTWLSEQAQIQPPDKRTLGLFIGPEGGYSDEEVEMAQQAGIQPVSMGKRILRMETAAVVAAALALFSFGEMD